MMIISLCFEVERIGVIMNNIKKCISVMMVVIFTLTLAVSNSHISASESKNYQIKELSNNYSINLDSSRKGINVVTVIDYSMNREYKICYEKENNCISESIIDISTQKSIDSYKIYNVVKEDNNIKNNLVVNKKDANYEPKVTCLYGDDYWYKKGKKRNYYRIGCKAEYRIKYSGNADRVKALDNYTNSIDKVNDYRKNALIQCGAAGVSFEVALLFCAINALLPEATVVEMILSAVGVGDGAAVVIAVTKCVHNIFKMIKEYKKVCSYYEKAKKYA